MINKMHALDEKKNDLTLFKYNRTCIKYTI